MPRHVSLTFLFILKVLFSGAQNYVNPLAIPPLISGRNFTLTCQDSAAQIYPGIKTNTFAFNGSILGPTLEFIAGDSVSIVIQNQLAEETSVHWHGFHIPAAMDGGPETTIPAGTSFTSSFTVKNKAATYWYHPHVHMNTQPQVTKGMAGLILVRDTEEAALVLPRSYGTDDFPIVLQDRMYDANNQFIIEAMGDSMLVNGTPRPYLDVPAQVVRLRLLNGSNARVYQLGFSDNRNFQVIASDASLLPAPVTVNRLQLANGERAEILVDLSGQSGTTVVLNSFATELPTTVPGNITGGMGNNGPLDGTDFGILELRIQNPTANPVTSLPTSLITVQTWDTATANRVRNRTLSGQGMISMGNFYMDGSQYIHGFFNDTMRLGDIELWHLVNNTNISHPIHVHDVSFRIVARNGAIPSATEAGFKDVFNILPQETVSFIMRFEDYADATVPYMYHCHNLAHEDMGMMISFIVVDTVSTLVNGPAAKDRMRIFPNPANQKWNIELEGHYHDPLKIMLFDLTGQLVVESLQQLSSGNTLELSAARLSSGAYFLKVQLPDGEVLSRKLVKN